MRTTTILASMLGTALATACSGVPCGPGTLEQNGKCMPASVTTDPAVCGADTMLVGTECVSKIVCDPDTTMPKVDPSTGMTVCVGTGGGGCTCPSAASSQNQQNICGQIYDFETNQPYAAAGATGAKCNPAMPTTDGPCAIGITAYDAIAFAMNPATATPLAVGDTCIDDMGHYVLKDITLPAGPYIGLGLDDIAMADRGPGGVTNTVGVASKKFQGLSLTNFEHWIVKPSTTTAWASSGGPAISTGYYAPVYRAHCANVPGGSDTQCTGDPSVNQAGVQFTKSGTPGGPSNTFYFQAAQTTRHDIDPSATSTGANGTSLVTNATLSDPALSYSGTGGITDTTNCKWDAVSGQTLPGVVFIQVLRPVNVFGKKCAE